MRRTVSVAERRGWERLPISIPFFVRGSTAAGEEFLEFATALNLSAGGVLLATRRYLVHVEKVTLVTETGTGYFGVASLEGNPGRALAGLL